MARGDYLTGHPRVLLDADPDHGERGVHLVALQHLEHHRCVHRMRAVIDRERDRVRLCTRQDLRHAVDRGGPALRKLCGHGRRRLPTLPFP
jgi:hypothetical protein